MSMYGTANGYVTPGYEAQPAQPALDQRPLTHLGRRWRRRSWLTPVLVFMVITLVGWAARFAHLPWGVPVPFILICPVMGLLLVAGDRFHDATRAYYAFVGVCLPAYVLFCTVGRSHEFLFTPFGLIPLTAWFTVAGIGFCAWPGTRSLQLAHEHQKRQQPPQRQSVEVPRPPSDTDAARIIEAFSQLGVPGLTFLERKMFDSGMLGFRFRLPFTGSVNYGQVAEMKRNLEVAFSQTVGSISTEQHRNKQGKRIAAEFWVYFNVEDILSKVLPDEDDDDTPLSIHTAFRIGKYADGTPFTLRFREVAVLLIALRRRGKSNLLHIILKRVTRCKDCWPAAIDLKGGRIVRPYIKPWLEGWEHPETGKPVDRPGLGWVAVTREEAFYIVHAFVAAINYRASLDDGDKIEPSELIPEMLLIIDELALLVRMDVGARYEDQGYTAGQFGSRLTSIVTLGGAVAVELIGASQRETVDMAGPGSFLSQFAIKLGMGFADKNEAARLFGKLPPAIVEAVEQMEGEDTRGVIIGQGENMFRNTLGRVFLAGPPGLPNIPHVALRHTYLWPDLDQGTADAMDAAIRELTSGEHGFHDRWTDYNRIAPLLREGSGDYDEEGNPRSPRQSAARPSRPSGGGTALAEAPTEAPPAVFKEAPGPFDAAMAILRDSSDIDKLSKELIDKANVDWQAIEAEFDPDTPGTERPEPKLDPSDEPSAPGNAAMYQWMVDFVCRQKRRGATGATVIAMMQGQFGADCPHPSTIYRWLEKSTCYRGSKPGKPVLFQDRKGSPYFGPGFAQ